MKIVVAIMNHLPFRIPDPRVLQPHSHLLVLESQRRLALVFQARHLGRMYDSGAGYPLHLVRVLALPDLGVP